MESSTKRVVQVTPPSQDHISYSIIGAIPQLSDNPKSNSVNISGFLKTFAHPTTLFCRNGSITESIGSFHQSCMNICKTFSISKSQALENLYKLFKTDSETERYFHKLVTAKARTLDQAFNMLYDHLISAERRDRLLQK